MDVRSKIRNEDYTSKLPYATLRRDKSVHDAYVADTERLRLAFQTDSFEELGIAGHPKAQAAFDIAWDERHSYGFGEVFDMLETLSELLK